MRILPRVRKDSRTAPKGAPSAKHITARKKMTTAKLSVPQSLYETDYYGWVSAQLRAMRKGVLNDLDIDNLIEEIEDLGKAEKRGLESHLENLLLHLLKQSYAKQRDFSEEDSRLWKASVQYATMGAEKLIRQNPSLKRKLKEIMSDAYEGARLLAVKETKLDIKRFPEKSPWKIQDLVKGLEAKFWEKGDQE